ncbi:MAG: vitamin K epoxide reductase family protein [Candidatus Taylorbacteria bacterium]
MQTLKNLLIKPLRPVHSSIAIAILVVALIGFADASYLAIEHFQGVTPPCSITSGCEQVLSSSYSEVLGIPVSLPGALFYILVAAGALAYLEGKHEKIFRYSLLITVFGFIASLWFTFLQIFVIHSYCAYCLGSALTSTTLFILACVALRKYQWTTNL